MLNAVQFVANVSGVKDGVVYSIYEDSQKKISSLQVGAMVALQMLVLIARVLCMVC